MRLTKHSLIHCISAILLQLGAARVAGAAPAPPPNDMFANAAVIPTTAQILLLAGANAWASVEPGEPAHAGRTATRSLWWEWTPAYAGRADFKITSAGANQSLAIYNGTALTNLSLVSANTNLAQPLEASFDATPGLNYWVAVDGTFFGTNGAVRVQFTLSTLRFVNLPPGNRILAGQPVELMATNYETDHAFDALELVLGTNVVDRVAGPPWAWTWWPNSPGVYTLSARGTNSLGELRVTDPLVLYVSPANDDFTNALEIPALTNGVASGQSSTVCATHESGEPLHLNGAGQGSVWFTWMAPWNGDIFFSTVGSQYDTFIVVYQGDALTNLMALTTGDSTVAQVHAGQRYYIVADATSGNQGPVVVSILPPPANNNFADAIELGLTNGVFQGSNVSADSEPGEPVSNPENSASIWWRWTAPALGDFHFNTAATLGMTLQSAVYSGSAVDALTTELAPSITSSRSSSGSGTWSYMSFRARPGRTYYFRFSGGYSPSNQNFGTYGMVIGAYAFSPSPDVPVNDDFAGRLALTGLTNLVQADNSQASTEPGEPAPRSCDPVGRSLWWSYTAPGKGVLSVSAAGQGYSALCAVYRGNVLNQLQSAGSSCIGSVDVQVTAGEVLQISVDGAFGGAGPFTLQTALNTDLQNDDFADSLHLEGTDVSVVGNNSMATLELGEPRPDTNSAGRTLWYSWAAPITGRVGVSAWGPAMIPAIGLYTGPTLDRLHLLKAWSGGDSFLAIEGTVYHLQVDGSRGGTFSLSLQVTPFEPPTNDNFSNAIASSTCFIGGGASVVGATTEPGEPPHLGGLPCKSVWWSWQAPAHGDTVIYSQGSLATNVVLAVYTGSAVEALTLVTKGNGSVGFFAVGGTTYYIAGVTAEETIGDIEINGNVSAYSPPSLEVPGNHLCEPSFENTNLRFTCWTNSGPFGGLVNEHGGADGSTCPVLSPGTRLWQEFPTVPGRNYEVRFAYRGTGTAHAVSWDTQVLGLAMVPPGEEGCWHWTNFTATATQTRSRVTFEARCEMAYLDATSVVWMNEAPAIITQPSSCSVFTGGAANFLAGARGSPPLTYQWYFDGAPLAGRISPNLSLENVSAADAGTYLVTIANAFGTVTSSPAVLVVEAPAAPAILLQPYSDRVAAGGYYALSVAAVGTPPLFYQWYRDGIPVTNATQRQVIFTSFDPTNTGTYAVQVSNSAGVVWSLPAILSLGQTNAGGGTVLFGNHFISDSRLYDLPVLDLDGVTRLNGSNFVAQLYAGPDLANLRAAGDLAALGAGFGAGIFQTKLVTLPTVLPGSNAFVQVRVWDRGRGASYEEARALGSKFGRSEVFQMPVGGGPVPAPNLTGLQSFSVTAGLPQFSAGRIDFVSRADDGMVTWSLSGQAGYRYVVLKSTNNFLWQPLLVLTNITGTATFSDSMPGPQGIYRARILD